MAEKKKQIPIIDPEYLHYDDSKDSRGSHPLNINWDSYVIGFCGPRGSGKTLSMTGFAIKMMAQGMRVISNYDIVFRLAVGKGRYKLFRSEPFDLFRLLAFDNDFQKCLILIDEAPLIISHLSSQSWKNRLLDIFLQQLRKNHNSLMYASQNERWVDNQMRWQTDVIFRCRDYSRGIGAGPDYRGRTIILTAMDNSGLWTGRPFNERYPVFYKYKLKGTKLFNTYDTYQTQDVFEALKKVDMKLSSYKVDGRDEADLDTSHVDLACDVVLGLMDAGVNPDTQQFYSSVGNLTPKQKDDVSKYLSGIGAVRKRHKNGKYWYDFSAVQVTREA